jgi:putative ABC transport system ATP-binding protein
MADTVVELKEVRKSYTLGARKLEVLKGVSIGIHRGEYVAIMGPSGSGKSTLLNIIGLLDVLDQGAYRLAGQDVSHLRDDDLANYRNAHIGFIFQSFNLFPQLDILGNIEVPMVYAGAPRRRRRRRAMELATMVGLADRTGHRPRELSGGEMQRTAVARALANDPEILLADEPTGNLDEKTGLEILAIFDDLVKAGRTIVLVTHNPAYRQRCHRLLQMHDGELVLADTDPQEGVEHASPKHQAPNAKSQTNPKQQ